jgi:ATP-dependent Clp protease adaptor protein ClpS
MEAIDKEETTEDLKLVPEPPRRVLLLNDDYTPAEFVVQLLTNLFHKSQEEAIRVMLQIHQDGKGVAGEYTAEIAETKVAQVHALAQQNEFPLQAVME